MELKYEYRKNAYRKVLFSMTLIAIYILGSNITLPGVDASALNKLIEQTPNATFALSMSGLSVENFSFFSIGFGPWISAMIFWRVVTSIKFLRMDNLTFRQTYYWRFGLTLILAVIQGLGMIAGLRLEDTSSANIARILLFIVTGVVILVWMGNLNIQYGIGSSMVIIMANMSRTWIHAIVKYIKHQPLNYYLIIEVIVCFIAVAIGIYISIYFLNGQLRLPIMHVKLDSKYAEQAYLPISTYPAGGMPLMYTFSMVVLLQFALAYAVKLTNNNAFLSSLYGGIMLNTFSGVIVVMIVMGILNYGFAFVNVDTQKLAESLKKSGDYFPNVYPGKNTEKYLSTKVTRMATIGLFFNIITIGAPMMLGVFYSELGMMYQLVPMLIMWTILLQDILRQFFALYDLGDYKQFVRTESFMK